MAALAEHYGWPHDYWRTMGYASFWSWMRARNRSVRRKNESQTTSPHSWSGGRDGWWQQQDAERQKRRGS